MGLIDPVQTLNDSRSARRVIKSYGVYSEWFRTQVITNGLRLMEKSL